MGVVLLKPYRGSQSDTVRAVQAVLAEAMKPDSGIGVVCILQRPGRDYSVFIAGEPSRDAIEAVFMSGMCDVLKDDLKAIIRRLRPSR